MQIRVGELRALISEAVGQAELGRIVAKMNEIVDGLKRANFSRLPKELYDRAERARRDVEDAFTDLEEYATTQSISRTQYVPGSMQKEAVTVGQIANTLQRAAETFDDVAGEKRIAKSMAHWLQGAADDIGHMSRALVNLGSGGKVRVQSWDAEAGAYRKNPYESEG